MLPAISVIFVISFPTIFVYCTNEIAEHSEYCITERKACYGIAENSLVIPCGPFDDFLSNYTYTNDSSKQVIVADSEEFLTVNLTVYDDKSTVICTPSTDDFEGPSYSYELTVYYPPFVWSHFPEKLGKGIYLHETSLSCPIQANPLPSCSWIVSWCFKPLNSSIIDNPFGVSYSDNGCILHISQLTVNYSYICFNCSAENKLGKLSFSFNSIDFSPCPDQEELFISVNDSKNLIQRNATVNVYAGDSLDLFCIVHGADDLNYAYWQPSSQNISDPNSFEYSANYSYNKVKCLQTGVIHFKNLSYSDSRKIACRFFEAYTSIYLNVIDRNAEFEGVDSMSTILTHYVGPSLIAVLFVIILIAFAAIALVLIRQRMRKLSSGAEVESTGIPFDEVFETEYDAFLSFAEEDTVFVETKLKIPLTKAGYNVCWHHDSFIPGYTIVENIERSIYKSRFMIAVLSNSFQMSDFCQRELSIASNRMQQCKLDNFLIPVILEKGSKLPSEVNKITYIQSSDTKFLHRVKSTLGNPHSKYNSKECDEEESI